MDTVELRWVDKREIDECAYGDIVCQQRGFAFSDSGFTAGTCPHPSFSARGSAAAATQSRGGQLNKRPQQQEESVQVVLDVSFQRSLGRAAYPAGKEAG